MRTIPNKYICHKIDYIANALLWRYDYYVYDDDADNVDADSYDNDKKSIMIRKMMIYE